MTDETEDEELAAIKTVLGAITPLKPEARNRVVDYVLGRLGITAPAAVAPAPPSAPQPTSTMDPVEPAFQSSSPSAPIDLRSFTEHKQPKTASHMVATLAYYLAKLAPAEERRDYIVPSDVTKYFPQANFQLPIGAPAQALVNAKNAGYLDARGGGQYRLTPVGHNLVSHKLPLNKDTPPRRQTRRAKRKKATT